jgi:Protein phosphatase 2C
MIQGWAGPAWGEPSTASESPVPLRAAASAGAACYRADGGWSAEFGVMAASVAGVAHRLAGRRCEDTFAWATSGPHRLALVIADGVSTAGRGGEGADLAARAVGEYLLERHGLEGNGLGPKDWGEKECEAALRAASAELVRAAGPMAAELSTTLVVALLTWTDGGTEVALARVGDSSAFVLDGAQWRELFPHPGDDDLRGLPVEVLPLGHRTGIDNVGIETASAPLSPGQALVLLTDGVADPLREGPETVAPALAELLGGGPAGDLTPLDLARGADFSRRGCQDDRTILVAWPRRLPSSLASWPGPRGERP